MKPKLLDLCCGSGGASVGYNRAGFDVTGVDIEPQPDYPFTFYLADALAYPLDGFDAYHASPPCKHDNQGILCRLEKETLRKSYPRLIMPVRERLLLTGRPFVIENVPLARAQLRDPIMLCGTMFGLKVRRHRYFELHGFGILMMPASCKCKGRAGFTNADRGMSAFESGAKLISVAGHNFKTDDARLAMNMPWAHRPGITQAIPPAYTEFIGKHLWAAIALPSHDL